MGKLGLSVVQKVNDELEAEIVARDAQDKKIIVQLVSLAKDSTQIKVHVGSPDKARRVYQTIREGL